MAAAAATPAAKPSLRPPPIDISTAFACYALHFRSARLSHCFCSLLITDELHSRAAPSAKPRFDQSTFMGRLRHFMDVTDFRYVFCP